MFQVKGLVILAFGLFGFTACLDRAPERFVVADSKSYETSLFRQHCAICQGTEADGKTLDNGTIVPSLRVGEFKFKTESQIYKQISEGGNGMLPFRNQLTERELRIMASFIERDLRRK